MHPGQTASQTRFLLRFESLFKPGRSLSFPCDATGCVMLDRLSDKARNNYFFSRATIGREYAMPVVEPALDTGGRDAKATAITHEGARDL